MGYLISVTHPPRPPNMPTLNAIEAWIVHTIRNAGPLYGSAKTNLGRLAVIEAALCANGAAEVIELSPREFGDSYRVTGKTGRAVVLTVTSRGHKLYIDGVNTI